MIAQRIPWQEKLQDKCRAMQALPPIYKEYSDRRGGRTAWSASVHIGPFCEKATYWYDGKCVDKAKDDAAENMLKRIGGAPTYQAFAKLEQDRMLQQQQQQYQHAVKMEQHQQHQHQQVVKMEHQQAIKMEHW